MMPAMLSRETRQVLRFFAITLVLSGIIWAGLPMMFGLSRAHVLIPGTFVPSIAAIVLTAVERGRAGVAELLGRGIRLRVGAQWYLFSLAVPVAVVIGAVWLHRAAGGTAVSENDPAQWYMVFPGFLQVFFLSVIGEEFGWRGYALPRLQGRYGPLVASLVIGVVWGFWHLPQWFLPGDFHSQIPFGLFLAQDIGLAVIMTWLFNHTKGSVFIAALFHTAANLAIGVAPMLPAQTDGSIRPMVIGVAALWLGAVPIIVGWLRRPQRNLPIPSP